MLLFSLDTTLSSETSICSLECLRCLLAGVKYFVMPSMRDGGTVDVEAIDVTSSSSPLSSSASFSVSSVFVPVNCDA